RTTANSGSETTWSLRVLRHYRQQHRAVAVPYCGRALLAVLAESPEPRAVARLGSVPSFVGAVSAPAVPGGPLGVRSRSGPRIGGTVCANPRTYGSVGAPGGQPPGATRPCIISCPGDGLRRSLPVEASRRCFDDETLVRV